MTRSRNTPITVLSLWVILLLVGCASDSGTEGLLDPTPSVALGGPTPQLLEQSYCIFDPALWCHGEPTFGGDADGSGGGTSGGCEVDDVRCQLRELSSGELGLIQLALALVSSTQSCNSYRSWFEGRLGGGFVKAYDWDDGKYGDVHYWGANHPGTQVHLFTGTFAGSLKELARTIIHETWHGVQGLGNEHDFTAELAAQTCVP